ncbi:hypothetical protein COLINT_03478 [Collinsella intestinalis DSM 13280]|uniref:Uncharacterized protein n=1 Tax=Collinsella intestinalis DSM 13280 TaxID=521003 RepID=C4FBL6_9ACTN|nr:hypothetical protein COLINT_03478 [Collinsella intestinalis DSM 13280]
MVYQAPLHSRTECVESHARLKWGQGLKWGQVRIGHLRCRADGRPGQSLGLHPSQLERLPVASQFHNRAATEAPW